MLEIRSELIYRINSNTAFWFLPDLSDTISLYLKHSDDDLKDCPYLVPLKNQFILFISSRSELYNLEAVQAMGGRKVESFWSQTRIEGIGSYYAELPNQFLGMFTSNKKEEVQDLEKGILISEFRILTKEKLSEYESSDSFPEPREGYSYYLKS